MSPCIGLKHTPLSNGDRVFHQTFGNGNVTAVDGNKLTIAFDKAGEKRGGGGMDEADNTMAARAVKAGAEPISPEKPPSSQI